MKLLALTPAYPPHNAAMTPVVERFIDALGMEGYIVGERTILHKSADGVSPVSGFGVNPIRYGLMDWEMRITNRLTGNFWPDRWREWGREAFHEARRIIGNSDEEIMLVSFSSPVSAHMQAIRLKKAFPGIRWVAYIADPLTEGIMYRQADIRYRRIIRKCEENIIRLADATVTLSRVHFDYLSASYDSKKIHYIPHCHDQDPPFPQSPQRKGQKLHVAHFGNIYPPRTILPFVDALNASGQSPNFRFSDYGSIPEAEKETASACSPLHFHAALPYNDFVRAIREADALVLIESANPSSRMHLPSKLIEYIGADRPVFGFCLQGSEGQRICAEMGYATADITSTIDCREKFESFLKGLKTGKPGVMGPGLTTGPYSPASLKTAVSGLLDEMRSV